MEEIVKGRAWTFGDNIDGDADIFPFQYFMQELGGASADQLAVHLLENLNPDFGKEAQKGDFIVAGVNFGCGKAHSGYKEMRSLGIGAIIADSAVNGFIKGCVNESITVLTAEGVSKKIHQGDQLQVNLKTGEIKNLTTGETIQTENPVKPGTPFYPIQEAGGYVAYLKKKVQEMKEKEA